MCLQSYKEIIIIKYRCKFCGVYVLYNYYQDPKIFNNKWGQFHVCDGAALLKTLFSDLVTTGRRD